MHPKNNNMHTRVNKGEICWKRHVHPLKSIILSQWHVSLTCLSCGCQDLLLGKFLQQRHFRVLLNIYLQSIQIITKTTLPALILSLGWFTFINMTTLLCRRLRLRETTFNFRMFNIKPSGWPVALVDQWNILSLKREKPCLNFVWKLNLIKVHLLREMVVLLMTSKYLLRLAWISRIT